MQVGYRQQISSSSLKAILDTKSGFINNDIVSTYKLKPDSVSMNLIVKEGIRSNMNIPLIINDKVFGIVFFSSKKAHHFTHEHYEFASNLIFEISGALNRSYLMKFFITRMTGTFAQLVDQKDIETGDHILRMVRYSKRLAEILYEMNVDTHPMTMKTVLDIERNAAIHDIGKVGTPDNILKKPGKLTIEEFEIMKEHASIGGDIFKELNKELNQFDMEFFKTAEHIARYHHEKWDGSGYPEGLSGFDIPLAARIVAVADVFDALTSKRVYKDSFPMERSINIIKEGSGKHFDPTIVDAFIKMMEER
jgi:response regulator RpfG family c-di-GMP phosphodiesterase